MHNGSFAAEIAHGVSSRKRIEIVEKARVRRAGERLKEESSVVAGKGGAPRRSKGSPDPLNVKLTNGNARVRTEEA
ncbi:hypothetical protein BCR35DRAFT_309209 [Leucosporidium creatinivorum]|uniref:Uncharacterized protein n=1 Tax=Leucosporidium creatinivorum TaxID=106004 RepID=A0A1Y2DKZ0_9BASI|nr:hypothetical protein BCR35DRAFT_309209 [Leucosporidium creatinivorum]